MNKKIKKSFMGFALVATLISIPLTITSCASPNSSKTTGYDIPKMKLMSNSQVSYEDFMTQFKSIMQSPNEVIKLLVGHSDYYKHQYITIDNSGSIKTIKIVSNSTHAADSINKWVTFEISYNRNSSKTATKTITINNFVDSDKAIIVPTIELKSGAITKSEKLKYLPSDQSALQAFSLNIHVLNSNSYLDLSNLTMITNNDSGKLTINNINYYPTTFAKQQKMSVPLQVKNGLLGEAVISGYAHNNYIAGKAVIKPINGFDKSKHIVSSLYIKGDPTLSLKNLNNDFNISFNVNHNDISKISIDNVGTSNKVGASDTAITFDVHYKANTKTSSVDMAIEHLSIKGFGQLYPAKPIMSAGSKLNHIDEKSFGDLVNSKQSITTILNKLISLNYINFTELNDGFHGIKSINYDSSSNKLIAQWADSSWGTKTQPLDLTITQASFGILYSNIVLKPGKNISQTSESSLISNLNNKTATQKIAFLKQGQIIDFGSIDTTHIFSIFYASTGILEYQYYANSWNKADSIPTIKTLKLEGLFGKVYGQLKVSQNDVSNIVAQDFANYFKAQNDPIYVADYLYANNYIKLGGGSLDSIKSLSYDASNKTMTLNYVLNSWNPKTQQTTVTFSNFGINYGKFNFAQGVNISKVDNTAITDTIKNGKDAQSITRALVTKGYITIQGNINSIQNVSYDAPTNALTIAYKDKSWDANTNVVVTLTNIGHTYNISGINAITVGSGIANIDEQSFNDMINNATKVQALVTDLVNDKYITFANVDNGAIQGASYDMKTHKLSLSYKEHTWDAAKTKIVDFNGAKFATRNVPITTSVGANIAKIDETSFATMVNNSSDITKLVNDLKSNGYINFTGGDIKNITSLSYSATTHKLTGKYKFNSAGSVKALNILDMPKNDFGTKYSQPNIAAKKGLAKVTKIMFANLFTGNVTQDIKTITSNDDVTFNGFDTSLIKSITYDATSNKIIGTYKANSWSDKKMYFEISGLTGFAKEYPTPTLTFNKISATKNDFITQLDNKSLADDLTYLTSSGATITNQTSITNVSTAINGDGDVILQVRYKTDDLGHFSNLYIVINNTSFSV